MKKAWTAMLLILLCAMLAGCSELDPVSESQIAEDLTEYYHRMECTANGSEISLQAVTSAETLEQTVNTRKKTAYVRCRVRAEAEDGSFARIDVWELSYAYNKNDALWELTDKFPLETEYELLSDLPEELCLQLLSENISEDFTFERVITNRNEKNATAVYTYESVTAVLGEFGTITLKASVDAAFDWQPDGGWKFTGSSFNDATGYTLDLSCHISYDGKGMLNSDKFSIDFDLVVLENLVCVENLRYQGSICTLGELHIGNANFSAEDEGRTALITFDFVRDARNIEQDKNYVDAEEYKEFYRTVSGTGTIRITTDADGACSAELSLPGFIAWKNETLTDFVKSGISPEAVQRADDEAHEPEPQPKPQPESDPEPTLELDRSCVGSWICVAPEGSGVSGRVEAQLSEDGTCSFVCSLDIGTISRNTTYKLVGNYAQLPTDLLRSLMLGGTPTIYVVYDAERDVLCTCLEHGMYIYFSRTESGETGGFFDPTGAR